jgi:hypothetical protein
MGNAADTAMQLAVYCSAEVLRSVHHEYNLHIEGREDNAGMLKFCKTFYMKYYDHDFQSLDEYVLGRDVKQWDKAALETLHELKSIQRGKFVCNNFIKNVALIKMF